MTIPTPFSIGFPLTLTPFKSRTEQQLDTAKSYFAVAFKPGYPLQASELNEIQEIFYIQKSLTDDLLKLSTGWTTGTVPWVGATPMLKDMITCESRPNGLVYIDEGWYYIKDPQINGGIGVWAYNDTNMSFYPPHNEETESPTYGLIVNTITVECTNSQTSENITDPYLQDQSNFNVIGGPCGAARISLLIEGIGTQAPQNSILVPMFKGPRIISGSIRQINFINDDFSQFDPSVSSFVSSTKKINSTLLVNNNSTAWIIAGTGTDQVKAEYAACLLRAEVKRSDANYYQLLSRKAQLEQTLIELQEDYQYQKGLLKAGEPPYEQNCGGYFQYPCGEYAEPYISPDVWNSPNCVECRRIDAELSGTLYREYVRRTDPIQSELANINAAIAEINKIYDRDIATCKRKYDEGLYNETERERILKKYGSGTNR